MYKRKYEKGNKVEKMSELENAHFLYIAGKLYHPGWWQSMQYGYLERQIRKGAVFFARYIGR